MELCSTKTQYCRLLTQIREKQLVTLHYYGGGAVTGNYTRKEDKMVFFAIIV